jgi:hypothetical protein
MTVADDRVSECGLPMVQNHLDTYMFDSCDLTCSVSQSMCQPFGQLGLSLGMTEAQST